MTKVTKKKPIPDKSNATYPFADMAVGDSIFSYNEAARSAAYQWGDRNEAKFTTRKEGSGWRIWRIE